MFIYEINNNRSLSEINLKVLFQVNKRSEMVFVSFLFLILLKVTYGHPAFDELMEEQGDDTALVESVVREARAVGPSHIDDLLSPGKVSHSDVWL